jgi:hypothetical protein
VTAGRGSPQPGGQAPSRLGTLASWGWCGRCPGSYQARAPAAAQPAMPISKASMIRQPQDRAARHRAAGRQQRRLQAIGSFLALR